MVEQLFPIPLDFTRRATLKNFTSAVSDPNIFKREDPHIFYSQDIPKSYENYLFETADRYVDKFFRQQSQKYVNLAPIKFLRQQMSVHKIPEIYHVVSFSCRNFKFINFISLLSVIKFSSSDSRIMYHTDCVEQILMTSSSENSTSASRNFTQRDPSKSQKLFKILLDLAGDKLIVQKVEPFEYIWEDLSFDLQTNLLTERDQIDKILNHKNLDSSNIGDQKQHFWNIKYEKSEVSNLMLDRVYLRKAEHKTDVYRVLLLLKYGGIFLDDDAILLKSHADLLNSDKLLIGQGNTFFLTNGFMMSPPNNPILKRWLLEYKFFHYNSWGSYSSCKIFELAKIYPEEVSIIQKKFVRPNFKETSKIFAQYYDWQDTGDIYNIHAHQKFIYNDYIDSVNLYLFNYLMKINSKMNTDYFASLGLINSSLPFYLNKAGDNFRDQFRNLLSMRTKLRSNMDHENLNWRDQDFYLQVNEKFKDSPLEGQK